MIARAILSLPPPSKLTTTQSPTQMLSLHLILSFSFSGVSLNVTSSRRFSLIP